MPTLVLPPRYTPDSNAIWKAAIQAGWEIERLQSWRPPTGLEGRGIVLYGEPLFAYVVASFLNIELLQPPADWLAKVPHEFRLRDVRFSDLEEARRLSEPAFVKPADDKSFLAKVYGSGSELPDKRTLDGSTPVLIAEPVSWEVEYRCFVLEGRVETWSPYLRDGELAQIEDGSWPAEQMEIAAALRFAGLVLDDPRTDLPPAVVLDVGVIAGRGWAVIEANPAWGSGIYGCDPRLVLQVIRRACIAKDQLSEQDRAWIISERIAK